MSYSPSERLNVPHGLLELELAQALCASRSIADVTGNRLVPFSPSETPSAASRATIDTSIEDELVHVLQPAPKRTLPSLPLAVNSELTAEAHTVEN